MVKKIVLAAFIFSVFFSCENEEIKPKDADTIKTSVNKFDLSRNAIKVADSIMYIAAVKSIDPEADYYMSQWLGGANTRLLADKIFDAVYNKKLKAYNYITGEEMTIEEVKELEAEFDRKDIGQILFTEDWYFDEDNLKMYKQVNSVMLAYLRYDDAGNIIGNKAGIRVYFNGTKPMRGAIDY